MSGQQKSSSRREDSNGDHILGKEPIEPLCKRPTSELIYRQNNAVKSPVVQEANKWAHI